MLALTSGCSPNRRRQVHRPCDGDVANRYISSSRECLTSTLSPWISILMVGAGVFFVLSVPPATFARSASAISPSVVVVVFAFFAVIYCLRSDEGIVWSMLNSRIMDRTGAARCELGHTATAIGSAIIPSNFLPLHEIRPPGVLKPIIKPGSGHKRKSRP